MSVFWIFLCIVLLVLLISWGKVNAFIAFLLVSVIAGFLLGMPLNKIMPALQKGMGDTLSSLIAIIVLGAMMGKLVAESGAARRITEVLMNLFGTRYIQWGLMCAGFIIGIPLFYSVGFVLMIPLIFSVVYQYKLPPLFVGLPMLTSLSVAHGFLPPHPSPAALVAQFEANMGLTLLYGIIIAIPTIIIAGPLFANTLKNTQPKLPASFQEKEITKHQLPGIVNSFLTALLPVCLLIITTLLPILFPGNEMYKAVSNFLGEPSFVMLIAVCAATFSLGIAQGKTMKSIMKTYEEAVKDVASIIMIIAGAGALKQILFESGVNNEIAQLLQNWTLPPLLLAWLIAAMIRVCVGSATIAGLTTAGIVAPLVFEQHLNPNLMVLSIGSGSLMFSHVNDPGFWMFKEYFNLTLQDTLRSWSLMETIVSVCGLAGVLILNSFV
jgi:Gnt-I system high-affinity gluconate transporter